MTTDDGPRTADDPAVLVVDDDEELATLMERWLETDYRVTLCFDGPTALEELGGHVDVVLVDRRMSAISGDRVVEEIRDRGIDCRISAVTAVRPDAGIAEMPVDEYLVKPVVREEIRAVVDRLLERASYDDAVREYLAAVSKYEAIRKATPDDAGDVRELVDRLETLRERVVDGEGSFEADHLVDGDAPWD